MQKSNRRIIWETVIGIVLSVLVWNIGQYWLNPYFTTVIDTQTGTVTNVEYLTWADETRFTIAFENGDVVDFQEKGQYDFVVGDVVKYTTYDCLTKCEPTLERIADDT